jgi:hypothetical protein
VIILYNICSTIYRDTGDRWIGAPLVRMPLDGRDTDRVKRDLVTALSALLQIALN